MRKLILLLIAVSLQISSAFSLERQANADYRARRVALSQKTNGGAILLFAAAEEGEQLYGFRQENNFYYLTGWSEPGAALLIVPAGMPDHNGAKNAYTEILFVPAHNVIREKYSGPKLDPDSPGASRITGFDHVEVLDKLRDEIVRLFPGGALPAAAPTVYTDLAEGDTLSTATNPLAWLRRTNAFGRASFHDVKPLIIAMRMVKDAGELEFIRKATDASIPAHLAAMHAMKPGINEREISALMQYEFSKRGCERPAYAAIVGSGVNSTVLHYDADDKTIEDGSVVVMDAGGEYSMYATDITRTLPANGKFTARQRQIYDIVLGAQRAAEAAFQAGKSFMTGDRPDSLFKAAYDYINSHGRDLHGRPLGQYFVHGLGHHVGLEVHDAADYDVPLNEGNVFTIEPGIYIPEEKLGIRIEDLYYVDASGKLLQLTAKLPHTADEVEREMAAR